MAVLPLSMIPIFVVPIAVLLHVTSLVALLSRSRRRAGHEDAVRNVDQQPGLVRP
jgi:hypothetical protein